MFALVNVFMSVHLKDELLLTLLGVFFPSCLTGNNVEECALHDPVEPFTLVASSLRLAGGT